MRRILLGLMATAAVAASTTLVAAPAQAATKPVTIKTIPTRSVDWHGSALVKPSVKKAKKVKILRKAITVYRGGTVLRTNRTSAKLRPGSYRVTTKVTYRYKGKKRVAVRKQRLLVTQGRCATGRDVRTLKVDRAFSPSVRGDSVATVRKKLHSGGSGESYTPEELIRQLEALKVLIGDEIPELVAVIDEALAETRALQAKGVTVLEDRTYRGCGRQDIDVYATFANGELIMAEDDSELMTMSGARAALVAAR